MKIFNDNSCGWIDYKNQRSNIKKLSNNLSCDYLIVGAGFTGLSAARKLGQIAKNKKIILVDDSLVRGTTSHKIVKMLYDFGAKEVHVRIASPEIRFPDFYGVDTPTKKELLAANKTNEEICKYIDAKSLKFLSVDGLYRAMGYEKRNSTYPQLTDHYFTGDYPVKLIDDLGDNKVTQLSLLSTKSNN